MLVYAKNSQNSSSKYLIFKHVFFYLNTICIFFQVLKSVNALLIQLLMVFPVDQGTVCYDAHEPFPFTVELNYLKKSMLERF